MSASEYLIEQARSSAIVLAVLHNVQRFPMSSSDTQLGALLIGVGVGRWGQGMTSRPRPSPSKQTAARTLIGKSPQPARDF